MTRSSTSPGLDQPLGGRAQHAAGGRHDQRGGHALVGHVADHEADPPVGQRDHVVEVAADLARRAVVGARSASRAGPAAPCGRKCCWISRATSSSCSKRWRVARLGLLLAHELAHPQRRRGLCGEVVEQLAVVRRVVLLAESRPEVEDTDQLALADQRDGQLDARRLQLAQRPASRARARRCRPRRWRARSRRAADRWARSRRAPARAAAGASAAGLSALALSAPPEPGSEAICVVPPSESVLRQRRPGSVTGLQAVHGDRLGLALQ